MSPGKPIILGLKVKGRGHKSQKNIAGVGLLQFCECWFLIVVFVFVALEQWGELPAHQIRTSFAPPVVSSTVLMNMIFHLSFSPPLNITTGEAVASS